MVVSKNRPSWRDVMRRCDVDYALDALARVQRAGGQVAYIDVNRDLDFSRAAERGVRLNGLPISYPDDMEDALDICEALVRSKAVDMIVFDGSALAEDLLRLAHMAFRTRTLCLLTKGCAHMKEAA